MALVVLLLGIIGLAVLAYGLSEVYGPLGFVTVGLGLLSAGALLSRRAVRR